MINELKKKYGKLVSGININGQLSKITTPTKQMKFCEAVNYSFDIPIRITNDNLECSGARRSIGFERNENKLIKQISENNNIPSDFIKKAFSDIPAINEPVQQITLGITEKIEKKLTPDIFIIYAKPEQITKLMQAISNKEILPSISKYIFLSVCGNIFANSLINKAISISFGCPESRIIGGVEEDRVILGIPASMIHILLNLDK